MSSTVDGPRLGDVLSRARIAIGASLQDVAEAAGCSTAYVHKLEQDRVRTPSPRVLAGLARALAIDYSQLMKCVGYDAPSEATESAPAPVARFSNAHVVQLLEALSAEVAALRRELVSFQSKP